jgi:hypothetical protein
MLLHTNNNTSCTLNMPGDGGKTTATSTSTYACIPHDPQGVKPLLLGHKDQMHLYAKPPAAPQASHNSSMQRLLLHAQQASPARSFLAHTLAMAMNAHKPQPSPLIKSEHRPHVKPQPGTMRYVPSCTRAIHRPALLRCNGWLQVKCQHTTASSCSHNTRVHRRRRNCHQQPQHTTVATARRSVCTTHTCSTHHINTGWDKNLRC